MNYMVKMLTQPSTYAGIAAVATAATSTAATHGKAVAILTGLMGLLAIFMDGAPSNA